MKVNKKLTIAVGVLITLVVLIGAVKMNQPQKANSKYGAEAVRILEKYKSFDISANEASKRLNDLMKTVNDEKASVTDEAESHKLTMLWVDMMKIYQSLYYDGSATGYEVDEAINKINADM